MADEITNIVLLQHIHEMKSGLEVQIAALKNSLEQQIAAMDQKLDLKTGMLANEMRKGFEEARQHRQALQEDLEATMRMLSRHEKKLARL